MDVILINSLLYLFFILYEIIPRFKKKQWPQFWFYVISLTLSFTISTLYLLGIKIPSPAKPIENLIKLTFGIKK